jgi:hypothetical protein
MEENLRILLANADALRAKGVLRVKCGDFEADLAPAQAAPDETARPETEIAPHKRSLRQLVEASHV